MQIPAYRIDDIKKAISEGTATPEDIETYAAWKADMAAERARNEALYDALVVEMQERSQMLKAQAELAQAQLADLAKQAEDRLKVAEDGE